MKNLKTIYLVALALIITLSSCKSDDDSIPIPPDYTSEFVGLWEFDNEENYADALFFGKNGEAFQIFYGDLNTVGIVLADFNTYDFDNNTVNYFIFGNDPVPYEGGNTFTFPGNSMTKVNGINKLSDLIETFDLDEVRAKDVSTFFLADFYNNLDGFGDDLIIPNPSADEGRYIRFAKSNLSFVEAVEGIGQNATSISIYDTNPFELLSVLENNNKFRQYQPSNPAFHHPAIDDIPFTPNSYNCHTVTNESGRDFISYNKKTKSFNYHDVNILHEQQGVSEFAFFELPSSLLEICGMDYVESKNKLIVTDSYNIHIFNIGFNTDGDNVSIFEHEKSISMVPLKLTNEEYFGKIQGLYYDLGRLELSLIIRNGNSVKLINTHFQL
ncbi:hypothetical protein FF125_11755 [Aureibaculum algae]|uniref:Uncharacterized protein n=1 Tax=Aureibaculum algae TaxID=2584122 RepID=A0A5B7TVG0_9FLAO|nr:hypothetical protein [Aureibaculum algae]QCX39076.1 hypothetical protein FF125_11755 [Aureibaculum algae]